MSIDDPRHSVADHLGQATLNAFATFAACELANLLLQAERIKRLIREQNGLLLKSVARDQEIKCTSAAVNNILAAARGRNVPAHEAVAKALRYTIANIEVHENRLSVQGEQMAVQSYRWFWAEALEAQRSASETGDGSAIRVFATHSAPIRFWDKEDFADILSLQDEFVEAGGVLNRIFIDLGGKDEFLPIYETVIAKMRGDGASQRSSTRRNIFYLRVKDDAPIWDFMLTYFKSKHYSCEWNPRHVDSNNSDIASCYFYVGRQPFEETYWAKWKRAVNLLRESGWQRTGLSPVLAVVPDESQLKEMLELPS